MKSFRTSRVVALAVALVAVTGAYWALNRPRPAAPAPKAPPVATAPVAPPPPAETAAAPAPPVPPSAEVAATERMYLAHASLRTPEVADPDSAANRKILETMVMKALQPSASVPPPTPPASSIPAK